MEVGSISKEIKVKMSECVYHILCNEDWIVGRVVKPEVDGKAKVLMDTRCGKGLSAET